MKTQTRKKWCLVYTETKKARNREIARNVDRSLCVNERTIPLIIQKGLLLETLFQEQFPDGIRNVTQGKCAALLALEIIRNDVRKHGVDESDGSSIIIADPYLGTYETEGIIEVPRKLYRLSGVKLPHHKKHHL